MICPFDSDCPCPKEYEDLLESGDMTCSDCERLNCYGTSDDCEAVLIDESEVTE